MSIRSFTDSMKRTTYEKQNGICNSCKDKFDIKEIEADHIVPWFQSDKTDLNNCQMLCYAYKLKEIK